LPSGEGIRSRCSDDMLWLPYAVCQYVEITSDENILDIVISFLQGPLLKTDELDAHFQPEVSSERATLFEHCRRAIEKGTTRGPHGLPLIGTGDWNDGMNSVGDEGKGESVWLAWFLVDVWKRFAVLCDQRGEESLADQYREQARRLSATVEQTGWDGEWYRRAYFDNGEPLGSHINLECQIDSLPQSWSVISGAGDPQRASQAMQAVDQRLVRRQKGLIQLFDPPFDKSDLHPGYIKGYVPGVRENGGQYTHAAIWTVMAFALLGDQERAWELVGLLNPINHATTPPAASVYKVEPYVIAADVYAVAPHTGRGGWTWYTGSAGWMYRLLIETLLGLNREGNQLRLIPRLPKSWATCKFHYRFGRTMYHIGISRLTDGLPIQAFLDGKEMADMTIPLVDDDQEHNVEVRLPVQK
jgi:cyclic beta-1,2-glucan synthetase